MRGFKADGTVRPSSMDAEADRLGALEKAESYLQSRIRREGNRTRPLTVGDSRQRGLDRLRRMMNLLKDLGDPHLEYPVVHVAGTSGKGSVSTMVAAIVRSAGLRTGLHVTPYLQTPLEKLVVNDRLATPEEFWDLVEWFKSRIKGAAADGRTIEARYGSTWVALTFEYFRRAAVELAVIEAGAGGRYDLTNVVSPAVAAVTSVGLDHVLSLGPTIDDIADHKAGVFKKGVPAIAIDSGDRAFATLESRALSVGAIFRPVRPGIDYWPVSGDPRWPRLTYRGRNFEVTAAEIGLRGAHQVDNGAVACAIADVLVDEGYPISQTSVLAGLRRATLAGRLEILRGAPEIVLDGAHNPDKAAALASALEALRDGRRLSLVLGVLGYKSANGIVAELAQVADFIVVTEPRVYMKAALPAEELGRIVKSVGVRFAVRPNSDDAFETAVEWAGPNGVVCVSGSLYLVGNLRERWYPSSAISLQSTQWPVQPEYIARPTPGGQLG